jgi:hypothetical protein
MECWQVILISGCTLILVLAVCGALLYKRYRVKSYRKPPAGAVIELQSHAKAFIGLYEPMRMIRDGELKLSQGVFADWDVRVGNIDDAPALARYWNEVFAGFKSWNEVVYTKMAGELLEFAKAAGIIRGEEAEVIVDRSVLQRYYAKDGVYIERGAKVKVETPYWIVGDTVLEKGIITEKGGNPE